MVNMSKPRGLFINPARANCSIFESGKMIYNSLLLSDKYDLDYVEVDIDNRVIAGGYNFFAFNYHHITMGWLDTSLVRNLPGLKLTFVLEVAPGNPFVLCPANDFDAYCAVDPTLRTTDTRVYSFPRPLEVPHAIALYQDTPIPIIGSFGFATPGKGFERIVEAVSREFEHAVIKINIPQGTYADDIFWDLHQQNYADYLIKQCKESAGLGIDVIVSRDFMTKDELINWCARNTINCFFYSRDQPGLSATTDQAISSGRPLAVSHNETFRHILAYVQPYPDRSLKESIAKSQREVLQMRAAWAPERFAEKFVQVLDDFRIFAAAPKSIAGLTSITLPRKPPIKKGKILFRRLIRRVTSFVERSGG